MIDVGRSPTIDLPLADRARRQGAGVVRPGRRATGCSSRPTGSRPSIASSPACRTRGRSSTSSRPGGSTHTADIVANHVVAVPDPNVLVARAAVPLPVEVIVRGHITGVTSTSLWQQYADGERTIYGYSFPDGLAQEHRAAGADRHADDEGRATARTTSR